MRMLQGRITSLISHCALFLTGTLLAVQTVSADVLRVAVASNFRPVVQELADSFSRQTGHRVTLSSASSGVLYNQIVHGAPFDVFLSADSERPAMLEKEGKLVGKPQTYAYGRLVFWQPLNAKPDYQTITEWRGRIAIANPETAPYGLAAKQVLEHFHLWGDSRIQLLQGANIQQAWQFVATGNVRAGFVALAQLRADKIDSGYLLLRDELYTPIRQDAAVIAGSKNQPLAEQFVRFLLDNAQQAFIQDAGYYPVRDVQPTRDAQPVVEPNAGSESKIESTYTQVYKG
ncbi:molybdate ABC transporter substrate-binding protein [Parendozoicomonas haliclonae]|uniref:Molybdate-binding periplasmic protein n=1 Tax=Parendozoicomonas haliclonae TaxID=1960125 RepID=A0A1X7AFA4_9GAMM|nr:molybdate ABC transporter substrate-binding protein [Parendozoicomonas haliclonae]SMA34667.1 Molybdate-binding periplasmic protein precursor [Parendozoicomonas haliclonae]